jgi:hypothetical protein
VRRLVAHLFHALFVAVMVEAVSAFAFFSWAWRTGAKESTPILVAQVCNHGKCVWVAPRIAATHRVLMTIMLVAVPSTILVALLLDQAFKVPIFGRRPRVEPGDPEVIAELRRRRKKTLAGVAAFFTALFGGGYALSRISPWLLLAWTVATTASVAWWDARTWRCPRCDVQLGRNMTPDRCFQCGVSFRVP